MSALVLVLTLMFGQSHVYAGQNVGIMFGCTPGDAHSYGVEFIGPDGMGLYQNGEC